MTKTSFTVSDLPESERPRERLQKYGPEVLSEQEILAAILGRGGAGKPVMTLVQELLYRFGGLKGLADASVEQLLEVKGVGLAKAAQLKAVFEISRRMKMAESKTSPEFAIGRVQDVRSAAASQIKDWRTEQFLCIMLNTRGKMIRCDQISKGSLNSTVVHPREVFRAAIAACAAAVVFVHNHPSGDPEPSDDDIALTKRLVSAGQLMGIPVHDHVIVTEKSYVSLRSRNVI
jgi:DNA repair protein RadC